MKVNSLSFAAQITLDLHNLNNEGTEGNQQETRKVHLINEHGRRTNVNAISGDMFKHILVDHLIPLLKDAEQPLSAGASVHDADRITIDPKFVAFCEQKQEVAENGKKVKRKGALDSEVMTKMLVDCSVTDLAGALVTTGNRSVGRKSVVEFGWVVGLPEDADGDPLTVTQNYFHVKYAPEGRGTSAGGDTVSGHQAIFHRPTNSGIYALICGIDLYRIGLNDITRQYVISDDARQVRAKALIQALAATLIKPNGAQRSTQNPHILACTGVIAISINSLPAPTVSPLHNKYRDEMQATADVLNSIKPGSIEVYRFESLSEGVKALADLCERL